MDMLFAARQSGKELHPIIQTVWDNRQKFMTRRFNGFIGYCNTQATKYSVKGVRLNTCLYFIDWLSDKRGSLVDHLDELKEFAAEHPTLTRFTDDGRGVDLFECIGRKSPLTADCGYVRNNYIKLSETYGKRSAQAASTSKDWKAVMHAIRVAYEAIELLEDQYLTFPRPERHLLLQIRNGEIPYEEVQKIISVLLDQVNLLEHQSSLPEEADWDWINEFIYDTHLSICVKEYVTRDVKELCNPIITHLQEYYFNVSRKHP